ncbi:M56 family metallopeptidase [Pontibacter sp. H259]|uniref:M56 family metallopeptidase n=1 Tax=Pontibacter sp. H259 TaxID=3133421 RepID=UPI0030C18C79
MNLISELATEALVKALGWTLLHSLWQGALVALTLALLLVLLQRHNATLRYYMGTGAMVLQLLLSAATFAHYYTLAPDKAATTSGTTTTINLTKATAVVPVAQTANWSEPLAMAQLYFEQHLPLIVTLWLLGLTVMALRFMGSLAYMQRLRYTSNPLGDKWQQTLQAKLQQIGVRQVVQLAESAMVKVPMVIGFAKPVILLPIGAVAGLSTAQVEAILAHELAHIRRNDFLVNLLQSVVDILFFYHPAMWWMSGVVRDERENCCDDMAVAVCGNSLVYARALAAIAEMQLPANAKLAMALAGRNGSLLSRIKRLVEQPALRPTFSEGFMAGLVVVLGIMFLSAGAMASMKEKATAKPVITIKEAIVDKKAEAILPDKVTEESLYAYTFSAQDTAGRKQDIVIIKNKKGDVTELYINGKQIPKKDIPKYNDLINQRLEATKNAPRATRVEVDRELQVQRQVVDETRRTRDRKREEHRYEYRYNTDGKGMNVPPPPPPAPPMPPAHAVPPVPPMPPMVPPVPPVMPLNLDGNNKEEAKKQQKAYEQAMKEYEKDMKRFQEDMKQYAQEAEARAGRHADVQKQRGQQSQEIAARRHAEGMKRHEESMKRHEESMKRHEASMKRHEELSAILDNVNVELVKDGLLKKNAQKVDFKIDDTGLYVDGKKQPQEVYTKYRKLMKTKDGKPVNYTYKKDGDNVNIMVKD